MSFEHEQRVDIRLNALRGLGLRCPISLKGSTTRSESSFAASLLNVQILRTRTCLSSRVVCGISETSLITQLNGYDAPDTGLCCTRGWESTNVVTLAGSALPAWGRRQSRMRLQMRLRVASIHARSRAVWCALSNRVVKSPLSQRLLVEIFEHRLEYLRVEEAIDTDNSLRHALFRSSAQGERENLEKAGSDSLHSSRMYLEIFGTSLLERGIPILESFARSLFAS